MLAKILYLRGKCNALLSLALNVTFAKNKKIVDYIPSVFLIALNN